MKKLILGATQIIFVAIIIYSLGVSNAKKSCHIAQAQVEIDTNYVHGIIVSTAADSIKVSSVAFSASDEIDLSRIPDKRPVKFVNYEAEEIKWSPKKSAKKVQLDYVKRFSKTAQQEQERYKIPASITLAQGLLESGNGRGWLAKNANNHFGVKCYSKKCKRGHCVNREDDDHKDFFRKYSSAWESFRMHSKFLQGKRYQSLYDNDIGDYQAWAYGLKKCGYATDPDYASKLIEIIEDLNLNYFDITT